MYGLFYSLILSMIYGTWMSFDTNTALEHLEASIMVGWKGIASLLRNIGLDLPDSFSLSDANSFLATLNQDALDNGEMLGRIMPRAVAAIIALIITIGIILLAIKGIKKIFSIFFMGIRR